jgi:hypothetical protein
LVRFFTVISLPRTSDPPQLIPTLPKLGTWSLFADEFHNLSALLLAELKHVRFLMRQIHHALKPRVSGGTRYVTLFPDGVECFMRGLTRPLKAPGSWITPW